MELYQLRALIAVAEAGHLTRAAERLHLSQPAVSAQIKALEDELGARLFERTSGGMLTTAAGKLLLEQAHKVLSAAEELRQLASSLQGQVAGKLRIGTISDPEFIRLGEFLSRAVERFPLLELDLHSEISGVALESVRDGLLDASFYFGELGYPGVARVALREMTYCVTAPSAWAERVRLADWNGIAALPWILTPALSTHNQLVTSMFRERGVEPARTVVADQESVISNLIVSGVGLSLLRESLALEKQRAGEVYIWDKVRLRTTLWFIYLTEREHDPLIEALVDVLKETWQISTAEPNTPAPRTAAASHKPGSRGRAATSG